MDLWSIFVLPQVRWCLNLSYDVLHDQSNIHHNMRCLMGLTQFRYLQLMTMQIFYIPTLQIMQASLAITLLFGGKKGLYLHMEEKVVLAGFSFLSTNIFPVALIFNRGMKEAVKSGKAEIVTTEDYDMKPGSVNVSDNMPYHLVNWVECMRNRSLLPNGNIYTGFWHSIASIMATQAYREGKKLYWDSVNELIVDKMPAKNQD